jgi:hypothetical protein
VPILLRAVVDLLSLLLHATVLTRADVYLVVDMNVDLMLSGSITEVQLINLDAVLTHDLSDALVRDLVAFDPDLEAALAAVLALPIVDVLALLLTSAFPSALSLTHGATPLTRASIVTPLTPLLERARRLFTCAHEVSRTVDALFYDVEFLRFVPVSFRDRLFKAGQANLHVVTLVSPHHPDLHGVSHLMRLNHRYQTLVVCDLLLADLDDLVPLLKAGLLGGAPLADRTYHSASVSLAQRHSHNRSLISLHLQPSHLERIHDGGRSRHHVLCM